MRTRSFLHRPAGRLLAGALSLWMVVYPAAPAFAQGLAWAPISQGFVAPKMAQDLNALKGNIEYVDNNLGAALLKIPPAEAGRVAFGLPWNTPAVLGVYDADSSLGLITVVRLLHLPSGSVVVEDAVYTPQDGAMYKPDFEGQNPFWQFIPNQAGNGAAPAGVFMNITPAAFETAVGLVMQHEQANQGWVAVNIDTPHTWNTNTCVDNTIFGCVRRRYTTHESVSTAPDWIFVSPEGEASGTPAGFLLPLPGTSPGGVSLRKKAVTLGVPASATLNGQTVGALKVNAGVTFTSEGVGNNLNHTPYQSFYHQQSTTSWTGVGLLLAGPFIMVQTGLSGANALIHFQFGKAFNDTFNYPARLLMNYTSAMVGNKVTYGHQINGACFSAGTGCISNPDVSAFDLTSSLTQIVDQYVAPGTTGSTNPLQGSSAWDPRPAIATSEPVPAAAAQGGFTSGYQAITPGASQAQKTNSPLSIQAMTAQKGPNGHILFDQPYP